MDHQWNRVKDFFFLKDEIKHQYLTEPATKVFLPVIIWWTFWNKNPVGPTGERGDKGQVSEMKPRSADWELHSTNSLTIPSKAS
jgi:hypothetical protein